MLLYCVKAGGWYSHSFIDDSSHTTIHQSVSYTGNHWLLNGSVVEGGNTETIIVEMSNAWLLLICYRRCHILYVLVLYGLQGYVKSRDQDAKFTMIKERFKEVITHVAFTAIKDPFEYS